MPLDPHVRRVLNMFGASGKSALTDRSPSARRNAFRKLMSLSDSSEEVGRIEDLRIQGGSCVLTVRAYSPLEEGSELLPALVYFHGGGLVCGDLETHDGICRLLCEASGCRVLSVDYRLAPENPFPAAVSDAFTATEWILSHVEELGIDTHGVGIGGDSAGATLAAVVCHLLRSRGGPSPAVQLLLCPITDHSASTESRRKYAQGYLVEAEALREEIEQYLPPGTDAADPRISPLRSLDFRALPTAIIHTAEFDPLCDEGRAYADRLAAAQVQVHYTCHLGMVHLFYGMGRAIPYARGAMKRIGAELRAALRTRSERNVRT